MDCENLPQEMADSLDQPWNWCGEVRTNRPVLDAICHACEQRHREHLMESVWGAPQKDFSKAPTYHAVSMRAYQFITGDMLQVTVFFGKCNKCGAAHWARQGPPFQRLRSFVNA